MNGLIIIIISSLVTYILILSINKLIENYRKKIELKRLKKYLIQNNIDKFIDVSSIKTKDITIVYKNNKIQTEKKIMNFKLKKNNE